MQWYGFWNYRLLNIKLTELLNQYAKLFIPSGDLSIVLLKLIFKTKLRKDGFIMKTCFFTSFVICQLY